MARPEDPARPRELVKAAASLFRRYGYERTTARDIARQLGVQSGSLFYHFRNKEKILLAVMLQGMGEFAQAARGPLGEARTPRAKLRALFYGHLQALHGGGDEQAVVISEMRSLSPRARAQVVKLRDDVEAVWREVLEEAAAAGLVKGDLRLLRLAMLGALNWTLQWYRPGRALGLREVADDLLAVFVPPEPAATRGHSRGAKIEAGAANPRKPAKRANPAPAGRSKAR